MTNDEALEILCAYGVPQDEKTFKKALDMAIDVLAEKAKNNDNRYHLIIRRSRYNVNRRFDDDSEEILVDAYDISLVCAYNIIKLYGNCVELKRLEGEDGKTV